MRSQPSPRWRSVVLGLAAALLVLGIGVVLVRLGSDEDSGADGSSESSVMESGPNPSRPSEGGQRLGTDAVDTTGGFARDEQGALAAAISYTAASQRWLYLSDDEVVDAVAAIATPDSSERLASEVVEQTRTAREELAESPGRVWWVVHPLAWRVESYSEDDARVAVWTVTVLSAAGVALPQSEWLTVTLDLEWIGDDWRVRAVSDRPGPTPMTGPSDEPWDSERFDDALDGFARRGGESLP
jgi:hypothetical protein